MKKIILSLIVIAVIVAGAFFVLKMNNPDNPNIPEFSGDVIVNKVPEAKDVTVQDVPVKNKTDNRDIDCVYPAIKSLKDKEFENYINNQIALTIQEYRNEMEFIVDEETLPTELYSYKTSYERYNNGKYLSLVIDQKYQTGGIRSDKWKDIYNINVETERLFYLNELFEPGVKFEEAIIAEITKQAEIKSYELMGGKGLTKLPLKQQFYIKDSKLFIYFDPSEAAATRFGELHFEMPFTMNEDGYFEI